MIFYYVNLDRRPDRRAHMEAALAETGLRHERVAAVDGQDPEVAAAAARLGPSRLTGRPISAGAHGCLQSQRTAWRRLLEGGASHAAILEDDMHLAPGIGTLGSPGWIPHDADLVKFETFGTRTHLDRADRPGPGGRRLARLRDTHVGGGGYVISAALAERLLAETEAGTEPVDEVLFNARLGAFDGRTVYQMHPAPAVQDKRPAPGAPGARAGWGAGSIETRAAGGDVIRAEGRAARLARRLREEARALRRGTRYAVVPFG